MRWKPQVRVNLLWKNIKSGSPCCGKNHKPESSCCSKTTSLDRLVAATLRNITLTPTRVEHVTLCWLEHHPCRRQRCPPPATINAIKKHKRNEAGLGSSPRGTMSRCIRQTTHARLRGQSCTCSNQVTQAVWAQWVLQLGRPSWVHAPAASICRRQG